MIASLFETSAPAIRYGSEEFPIATKFSAEGFTFATSPYEFGGEWLFELRADQNRCVGIIGPGANGNHLKWFVTPDGFEREGFTGESRAEVLREVVKRHVAAYYPESMKI